MTEETDYAFGPVPSRRLGRSLGINNIPAKVCTYSCVYCQLGRTSRLQVEREAFYNPEEIVAAVERKAAEARARGEEIDYLTFVPDGEPTLDANLGREIELLRGLMPDLKVAVITNASLLDCSEVRADLRKADWVSLKVDAASEAVWRRVNRPHGQLKLREIHAGMREFAQEFKDKGKLVTETMLIAGVNDHDEELARIADFLAEIEPEVAYLAVPTRPPAEPWVEPPSEERVNGVFQAFSARLPRVELLIGYEGDAFAATGDVEEDLLSITAVHPMRREAVEELLRKTGAGWEVVERLLAERKLLELEYQGKRFYLRKLPTRTRR